MPGFLWLRQVCLVARVLEPVESDLAQVFDLGACLHDNLFGGKFGIHNVVFPVAGAFLEVTAPHPGADPLQTPAGRYLERRKGDGGYMVILECDDVDRRAAHMESLGVRIVLHPRHDDFNEIQLHPRDTGGALIAINETRGRTTMLEGPYSPAGPQWWLEARTSSVARGIPAVELQSADPENLALRWSRILEREVSRDASGVPAIRLDVGSLRFVEAADGRGEGLAGVDIAVTDPPAVLATAQQRGLATTAHTVLIGGTRFRLVPARLRHGAAREERNP